MMILPVYAERLYGTLTTNVPYTEEASPQILFIYKTVIV